MRARLAIPHFNVEGRLAGCYVYMLLCQEADGPVYVKIGMTEDPLSRFRALRSGSPHTPRAFAYFETYNRKDARRIERALHKAYGEWHAHHEWFSFREEDKAKFNAVWKTVLQHHEKNGRKFEWTKVSAKALIETAESNKKMARAIFARSTKRRGRSYQDFRKHSASSC